MAVQTIRLGIRCSIRLTYPPSKPFQMIIKKKNPYQMVTKTLIKWSQKPLSNGHKNPYQMVTKTLIKWSQNDFYMTPLSNGHKMTSI
jgi:hypothetical protein